MIFENGQLSTAPDPRISRTLYIVSAEERMALGPIPENSFGCQLMPVVTSLQANAQATKIKKIG
jgi:hypothetical protein